MATVTTARALSQDGNDDGDDAGQLVAFPVTAATPPPGRALPSDGPNLAALERSAAAAGLTDVDAALLETARTAARVLDYAATVGGKTGGYLAAQTFRPYQDVLAALGIGGRGEAPGPAGASAAEQLLEAFGAAPAAPEVRDPA